MIDRPPKVMVCAVCGRRAESGLRTGTGYRLSPCGHVASVRVVPEPEPAEGS